MAASREREKSRTFLMTAIPFAALNSNSVVAAYGYIHE
jgi:nitrate reductase NapE component